MPSLRPVQDEESSGAFASYDTLQFLKARLTEAEVANRQASHSSVFASYMDIANHYQGQHDYQTAIYFLTKALDVARLANDVEREADANQMLGLAHERMGNLRTAIEFHEKRRDLVTASGVELTAENGRHLIGAYKALAEELQRTGDYVAAIGYYERSLEAAKSLQDYAGEGLAYQQLGNAYLLQKDFSMAADCFKKFLLICQETDDKIAEGSACSALASAYEALGDRTSSIKYLEAFYEVWPPPITSPFLSPLLFMRHHPIHHRHSPTVVWHSFPKRCYAWALPSFTSLRLPGSMHKYAAPPSSTFTHTQIRTRRDAKSMICFRGFFFGSDAMCWIRTLS